MQTSPISYEMYQALPSLEKSLVDFSAMVFQPIQEYDYLVEYPQLMRKESKKNIIDALNNLRLKNIIVPSNYKLQLETTLLLRIFPEIISSKDNKSRFEKISDEYSGKDTSNYRYSWGISPLVYLRDLLVSHFTHNKPMEKEMLEKIISPDKLLVAYFMEMINDPNYFDLLLSLPLELIVYITQNKLRNTITKIKSTAILENFIQYAISSKNTTESFRMQCMSFISEILLYKGNIVEASSYAQNQITNFSLVMQSFTELYKSNYWIANQLYEESLIPIPKVNNQKKKNSYDISLTLNYYILLLIEPSLVNTKEIDRLIKQYEKSSEYLFLPLLYLIQKNKFQAEKILFTYLPIQHTSIDPDFGIYCILISKHIINNSLQKNDLNIAQSLLQKFSQNGQWLMAREIAYLLKTYSKDKTTEDIFNRLDTNLKVSCLMSRIVKQEPWELSLEGLLHIFSANNTKNEKKEENFRIAYFVDFENLYAQPILQTMQVSGNWSKGRNIALKRLKENSVDGISEQDRRISMAIKSSSGYYGATEYYFDIDKLMPELAGHPYLFLNENTDISVELIKAQPELITEKTSKGYILKMDFFDANKKIIIRKETNTRYLLYILSDQQLKVIQTLNKGTLVIPEKGKEKLMKAIGHISSILTVHSDMTDENKSIKTIDADSRIRVQLLPVGDLLRVELFVKPFNNEPPYTKPGKGGQVIYGTINNEKCQAVRNLKTEIQYADKLAEDIAIYEDIDLLSGPITFDDPHQCLNLLDILAKNADIAVIEWPEGERFRVKKFASFTNLSLSVKGKGYWFEMNGELKVDEETILTLKELLELSKKSRGRFIELGKGEFLSLTEDLKKRIDELAAYTHTDKSGITLNKFAAQAINNISKNAGAFSTDKHWKDFQKKLNKSATKEFEIPETLDAELRPYQEEGFRWMARLSEWNAGACLADDMGLGKTVQTIAVLLHRADIGPAMVVCPASVVSNWISEIEKFAPTLHTVTLRQNNREETFESLAAYNVLIITYGLLQSEEERIAKMDWATVVLDEAHAIKNTQTKSSKAAMSITAGFRITLTGTPIQNHLGELWNLFNFCNPGLLGTLQQFNNEYVNPIVKENNVLQKQYLKKLLAPFILRRTKNAVLEELPPKSEITRRIELSEKEMAYYEALRRQAIENIESDDSPTGQKHLRALAEITRLRQACCNPLLVDSKINLPSSKLETFFEIVDELKANNHRALVFSQFVGHLAIVRKELNKRKITYQYLDGSSPLPEREVSVKAFQSGSGDLFLISLKAGGLGLNLTAADFVIHLDPWWNPAIEDQASDRAHRIGQTKPVTIYRLVAKDTIEEKILQLHSTKRDLADSLLEGSDQSAKMSTNDLLKLLKEA